MSSLQHAQPAGPARPWPRAGTVDVSRVVSSIAFITFLPGLMSIVSEDPTLPLVVRTLIISLAILLLIVSACDLVDICLRRKSVPPARPSPRAGLMNVARALSATAFLMSFPGLMSMVSENPTLPLVMRTLMISLAILLLIACAHDLVDIYLTHKGVPPAATADPERALGLSGVTGNVVGLPTRPATAVTGPPPVQTFVVAVVPVVQPDSKPPPYNNPVVGSPSETTAAVDGGGFVDRITSCQPSHQGEGRWGWK